MKTLSVVLATFNEENTLSACLRSVEKLADEIIIVDGTSTDKTVDIAKSFGAKVLVTDNHPNFHINKQKAIDMATKDWILQLDADERVSQELQTEIREKINQNSDTNGYWMPRKNYFLGRFLMKGGQYPDYTLRLYRKNTGHLPQKDVHEQAVVDGAVGYLTHPLLHYPYKDFNAYITKWIRYNKIFARQIKQELQKRSIVYRVFAPTKYLLVMPLYWFLLTYIRHKGFMDLWSGFVFSLFSSLRYPFSYILYTIHR